MKSKYEKQAEELEELKKLAQKYGYYLKIEPEIEDDLEYCYKRIRESYGRS